MFLCLFLGRIPCRRPSLPLHPIPIPIPIPTTPLASTSCTTQASPPHPHFSVQEFLVQSCGLSYDQAVRASKHFRHLRYPDRSDAVLQFLRQIGISEPDIRTAVSREPRLLCSSVERNLRPVVAKLQEVGLSVEDISCIISRSTNAFLFNFVPKIDFWLGVLGSAGNLTVVLKKCGSLNSNLENVVVPNLSFLQDQCGLSAPQIVQLIKLDPRLITSSTETLKMKAERAEKLGVARSSGMFVYTLIVVSNLSKHTIDARLNNLKNLGLSQEEVTTIVSRQPFSLKLSEEMIRRKIDFLRKEAGRVNLDLVRHPAFLTYSLDNRLIPRKIVRNLLMSKGLPPADNKFVSFVLPTEKQFVEKYVLPYEQAIPGLRGAYASASAGNNGGII